MTRHGKDAGNTKAKWTWNILKYSVGRRRGIENEN